MPSDQKMNSSEIDTQADSGSAPNDQAAKGAPDVSISAHRKGSSPSGGSHKRRSEKGNQGGKGSKYD